MRWRMTLASKLIWKLGNLSQKINQKQTNNSIIYRILGILVEKLRSFIINITGGNKFSLGIVYDGAIGKIDMTPIMLKDKINPIYAMIYNIKEVGNYNIMTLVDNNITIVINKKGQGVILGGVAKVARKKLFGRIEIGTIDNENKYKWIFAYRSNYTFRLNKRLSHVYSGGKLYYTNIRWRIEDALRSFPLLALYILVYTIYCYGMLIGYTSKLLHISNNILNSLIEFKNGTLKEMHNILFGVYETYSIDDIGKIYLRDTQNTLDTKLVLEIREKENETSILNFEKIA